MSKEVEEIEENDDLGVIEDDEQLEEEAVEVEEEESEELEEDEGAEPEEEAEESEETGEEESEELVIEIEGEEPEIDHKSPKWAKHLRQQHKALKKKNRELEEKLSKAVPKEEKVELGAKPTLADSDYDEEKFEASLVEYHSKKSAIEKQKAQEQERQLAEQTAWQEKLEKYNSKKKALPVKDFDDSEANVLERLNDVQQSVILQVAKNPELLVYALGKSEKRLEELAKISDPVALAYELAKVESSVKTTTKKKSIPKPERKVSGSGSTSGTIDNKLEKLRAEAAKSGNYTKVTAYKNSLKK